MPTPQEQSEALDTEALKVNRERDAQEEQKSHKATEEK